MSQCDVLLRTACLPPKLARFISADTPPDGADQNCNPAHHPDAGELARGARERQPVERVTTATLRAELILLDLAAYDERSGTLRLAAQPAAAIVALSRAAQQKMEWWLMFRGSSSGRLFDLSPTASANETIHDLDDADRRALARAKRDADPLEEEDLVLWLCRGQDRGFHQYLLGQRHVRRFLRYKS